MPTYEYGCNACGSEWELVQRITEAPVTICPKCGKAAAHRLISAGTNFILKGGGWYSDLYSSPKTSGKKAEPTDTTATGSDPSGKTDGGGPTGKPETKGETKSEAKASTTSPSSPAASSASSG